jgi:hypothetical protein
MASYRLGRSEVLFQWQSGAKCQWNAPPSSFTFITIAKCLI